MRILVAEDERNLNELISKTLAKAGYAVDSVLNGDDALDWLATGVYDAAVLDVMMPGKDGFEVIRAHRAAGGATPALFLTARDSVRDRVEGLDAGADDYVVKPFSLEELLARVRALVRRGSKGGSSLLSVSDLTLDRAGRRVKRGGEEITLSAKEFAVLEVLMAHAGQVLDRETILRSAWDYGYEGESNMVDVYIRYLRRKIDSDGAKPKLIHTVRGAGYVIREE